MLSYKQAGCIFLFLIYILCRDLSVYLDGLSLSFAWPLQGDFFSSRYEPGSSVLDELTKQHTTGSAAGIGIVYHF